MDCNYCVIIDKMRTLGLKILMVKIGYGMVVIKSEFFNHCLNLNRNR